MVLNSNVYQMQPNTSESHELHSVNDSAIFRFEFEFELDVSIEYMGSD